MSVPRNREIGFVLSSFSFRACVRASVRGEAAWAHVERYPYRWASRVLGSTCVPVLLAVIFCAQVHGFYHVLVSMLVFLLLFTCPAHGFYEARVNYTCYLHVFLLGALKTHANSSQN